MVRVTSLNVHARIATRRAEKIPKKFNDEFEKNIVDSFDSKMVN